MIYLIAAFAAARISAMLVEERGPFDIFYHFREKVGIRHDVDLQPSEIPERFIPLLFSCIKCTSIWVGFAIYGLYLVMPENYFMLVLAPFALSGAAVLIDSHTYKG